MLRTITASPSFPSPRLVRLATPAALACVLGLAACGGPPQRMMNPTKEDGVAANSASEQRLASEEKPKATSTTAPEDLTQPLTTPLSGGGGDPSAAGNAGAGTSATAGTAAANTGGKGGAKGAAKGPVAKDPPAPKGAAGKVSKAECKQTFDKYIDLTIGTDSRFEGIPPEMIAQIKEQAMGQAQSQKGDPCSTQDVTRMQYNCAMSAPTTAAWQRCMK